MPTELPFLPGTAPARAGPLARYLPRLEPGVVGAWLGEHAEPGDWVLDPFGAAPGLAVEAARAGYRVLVAANNPINRFLLEMAAAPPTEDELRAALSDLAASRRGEERLEPHILSLYVTRCDHCRQEVFAQAFLWEREALTPYARVYTCPHCENKGEFPATEEDRQQAARFASSGLHRARALERIASPNNPDRAHAEEALDAYLPRAVYALFSMINKLDGLDTTPERLRLLHALLLSACDQGDVLWSQSSYRPRPRQLTVPRQFREHNLWFALENAIPEWVGDASPVPLSYWPQPPAEGGGLSIYEGRLRDLVESLPEGQIHAVVSAFPRPNQAFWTLSALWAGWLWGKDALGPFVSVLRRRRYDWAWHTTALHAALANLFPRLAPGTPFFGLVTESEAGFDAAAMLAAQLSGFHLENYALRPLTGQSQFLWAKPAAPPAGKPPADATELIQAAPAEILRRRGQPAHYLHVQAAALRALIENDALPNGESNPGEIYNSTRDQLEFGLTFRSNYLRYGAVESSIEVGQWWLEDEKDTELPLADRVEKSLVNHLIAQPGLSLPLLDAAVCAAFPGALTPALGLVEAVAASYARQDEQGNLFLREDDAPAARRADLDEIQAMLARLGQQLGLQADSANPLHWLAPDGTPQFTFHIIASAVLGEIVLAGDKIPGQGLIVLPGGRAGLVLYKLTQDPRLKAIVEQKWRFLKFRHVRRLAESPPLTPEALLDQFTLDPMTEDDAQMPLL